MDLPRPPICPETEDRQSQPCEGSICRYLSQTEDGVPPTWVLERSPENQYLHRPTAKASVLQKVDELFKDGNETNKGTHSSPSCQLTSHSKKCCMNPVSLCHLQQCPSATKGGYSQPSNSAHHVDQSENILAPQHMQYWAYEQIFGGDGALQPHLPAPDYSGASFSIEENIESFQSVQLNYFPIDGISGSQLSLLPELDLPNPEGLCHQTYDICMNGIPTTHTNESFSYTDANHSKTQLLGSHTPSVPFSSPKALSITGGRKHGCTTTASYLSGPRSVDEVFSHKSFSTTHTNLRSEQNGVALCNFGSKQVNTAEPNAGNRAIQRCSSGRKRSRQIEKSRTESKSRRVDEMDKDEDASGRSYSCPFYLRSPADYGEGKWELCANGGWPSYHRVREHLLRKHIQPTIVCDRCFEDFKDDVGLKKHDASICEKKEHSPYLNKNQQREIEAPIKRGMREAEKLKYMCRRIFPGEVVPNPNINHLELRLRSVIASFLDASSTDGFRQQTVQHIMDVTLQEIRSVSYTAGAKQVHNHQRCDGVENA